MSQGQRSRGSRSKVKWGKPGLKAMMLADGLTPTSSCIFYCFLYTLCIVRSECRAVNLSNMSARFLLNTPSCSLPERLLPKS